MPILFAFVLILPSISYGYLVDRTVALVNKNVITMSDVEKFKQKLHLRRELDPFVAFFNHVPNSEQDIIDFLVEEALIFEKFKASAEEIENEIRNIEKKNQINRERLKEVLRGQNVTLEDYTQLMEVSLAKRKLMDQELRPLSVVTDDEVKNYYLSNPEFAKNKSKNQLVPTYHLQQILISNRPLLDIIVDKLRSNENTENIHREYENRGIEINDLGNIREDRLSPQFQRALQALKAGDVTTPMITGKEQYVLLKIVSISAPENPLFEREKEKIRGFLFQKAMAQQLNIWTERQKSQAYIHLPKS